MLAVDKHLFPFQTMEQLFNRGRHLQGRRSHSTRHVACRKRKRFYKTWKKHKDNSFLERRREKDNSFDCPMPLRHLVLTSNSTAGLFLLDAARRLHSEAVTSCASLTTMQIDKALPTAVKTRAQRPHSASKPVAQFLLSACQTSSSRHSA